MLLNTMRGFLGYYQLGARLLRVASIAKDLRCTTDYYAANYYGHRASSIVYRMPFSPTFLHLSTCTQPGTLWEGSTSAILLRNLEVALQDDCVHEAWEAFRNFKRSRGFPQQQLVSRMIIQLSYSSNPQWLHKAYDLVLAILKEKPGLLHHDSLTRLALTLARAQMAVPAATVLRMVLERCKSPPIDIWSTLFSHLVKTQIGSYFASDILIEICGFLGSKQTKLMKPSTTIFNLVLDSCLRFRSILKAHQIIELMPRAGVVADANSILLIARVFELMGRHDELQKLRDHVVGVSSVRLNHNYRQFYESLLSLHFLYNDLDAAAELVLDLYRLLKCNNGLIKHRVVQIGSSNLRTGSKIIAEPEKLQTDFVIDAWTRPWLVHVIDGRVVPSNIALAKLINGYVKGKQVRKLSNLLISIQKETGLKERTSLSFDVIDACIQLGWLESAHDILDDMEAAAIPIGAEIYVSLLNSYRKENMLGEGKVLLKQMRKAGHEDPAVYPLDERTAASDGRSCLTRALSREAREEVSHSHLLYEFNSSILFFCKSNMIEDALKTLKRMKQRHVRPTSHTFYHLVNGYSSMKMYREITILWGEIRRSLEDGALVADRDLFEVLLWNFLRGGYFERVMEIISYMVKHNMYIDRWKFRTEFLKLHKDLYRNLKASDARTEAQIKRLEHVRAFRRWAGIHTSHRMNS